MNYTVVQGDKVPRKPPSPGETFRYSGCVFLAVDDVSPDGTRVVSKRGSDIHALSAVRLDDGVMFSFSKREIDSEEFSRVKAKDGKITFEEVQG